MIKEVKRRNFIKIIDGGMLNYCDEAVGNFITYLEDLENTDLATTKGYRLIRKNNDAILELLRVSIQNCLGIDCEPLSKMSSIKILIPSCKVALTSICNKVLKKKNNDSDIFTFIQGCITEFYIIQSRLGGEYKCKKMN